MDKAAQPSTQCASPAEKKSKANIAKEIDHWAFTERDFEYCVRLIPCIRKQASERCCQINAKNAVAFSQQNIPDDIQRSGK